MQAIPRDVAQTVITKLDLGHITLSEARAFIRQVCGIEVGGRTKDRFIREIARAAKPSIA